MGSFNPNLKESLRLVKYLDKLLDYVDAYSSNGNVKRIQGLSPNMYSVLIKTVVEETKKGESQWLEELKPKLNQLVPKKYRHTKRPQQRMFPYRMPRSSKADTGHLVDSLDAGHIVDYNESQGIAHITAWAEIKSLHGLLTNYGITQKGIGTSKGNWAVNRWMEKVLHSKTPYGSSKYGYVTSFDTIIHNIFRSKRLYNRIYYVRKKLKEELLNE